MRRQRGGKNYTIVFKGTIESHENDPVIIYYPGLGMCFNPIKSIVHNEATTHGVTDIDEL